ncbi:hypothetical protein NQ314_020126 [Rhamnusium bicolor]|uniref:Tetraspanin n=1 Tax=Rhamnusium bicolor TaxID=1586634 RepID=A0AAV8WMN4_9CUCU|nr:hypothetical protein NQ314_020126 [Rhamnusium bicolor]
MFSVCMVIIFIFELSVGIAGYVLRDKTANYLETKLTESMGKYNSNSAIGDIWDSMQSEVNICLLLCLNICAFKCCGAVNMTDWYSIFNSYDLPVSCCPEASGIVGVFYCNAFPEVTTPTTPTTVSTSSTTTTVTTTSNNMEYCNIAIKSNSDCTYHTTKFKNMLNKHLIS